MWAIRLLHDGGKVREEGAHTGIRQGRARYKCSFETGFPHSLISILTFAPHPGKVQCPVLSVLLTRLTYFASP